MHLGPPQGAVLKPLATPWVVLGCLGALLEISGAMWWRFLAKFGRRWAQDGRKMVQVGSKLRPRWAMMASRWPSWAQFGSFLGGPGTTCGWPKCKNEQRYNTFTVFRWVCLGSVLGALLEDVGSKMVFSWLSWVMFGHLGAKAGEQGR